MRLPHGVFFFKENDAPELNFFIFLLVSGPT